ncbi:hypothetical protein GJ496_000188 [Pomphorhynchus laevis]|nr:hypothetical protein GJ496_000188 [Pomphorhynchus laevis]
MNENEIFCVVRKKKAYKDSWEATKEDKVCANKLNRVFDVGSPREILLTDITYLHCSFGTAYLSAVKDCITKEIIAFVIKDNMKIGLSLEVVSQLSKLHLHTDAYVHSDQGIHYTSKQFRNDLIRCGIGQSMSRRGKCIDNAPMESFFGHFKDEVDYEDCKNLEELIYKINEYMVYYNHQRKQWNLKKMTPVQYRYHLLEQTA